MKRIGIITHYYNSTNYGGNLQSYALVTILQNIGYQSEQICYDQTIGLKSMLKVRLKRFSQYNTKEKINILQIKISSIIYKYLKKTYTKRYLQGYLSRKEAVSKFNQNQIPHSEAIYTSYNISQANDVYDCFITGSDQVWHTPTSHPAFFLGFGDKGKYKISYAASIARDSITPAEKDLVREYLKDYTAISVREQSDAEIISKLSPLGCPVMLDPTLLIDADHWSSMASERVTEDKYIFTYFLGDYKISRNIAREYAKQKNLKIITIPHLKDFCKSDLGFGHLQISDVPVEKFLSLIKYAEYVFTDSFHAGVFSHIFQREYFIFQRNKRKEMTSRIYNMLELTESPERFCDTTQKETLEYINSLPEIDYTKSLPKLQAMKEKSLEYLLTNLAKI